MLLIITHRRSKTEGNKTTYRVSENSNEREKITSLLKFEEEKLFHICNKGEWALYLDNKQRLSDFFETNQKGGGYVMLNRGTFPIPCIKDNEVILGWKYELFLDGITIIIAKEIKFDELFEL